LSTGISDGGVVALVGPTASGKSALALAVADALGSRGAAGPVELVSVDSMAVYRGMDIGTAKPSPEVRSRVAYHLVDLVDASESFTVQQFQACARQALAAIGSRGNRALLVGGTGLHLRSVVDDLTFPGRFPEVAHQLSSQLDCAGSPDSPSQGAALRRLHDRLARLDPVAAGRIEPTNRRRLVRALEVSIGSGRPFSSFGPGLEAYPPTFIRLVGIRCDPEQTDRRIAERVEAMMAAGLLDEVRKLRQAPGGLSRTARQALGYRELLAHLEEALPLSEAVDQVVRRTRTFARRQWSWFRRDPRIVWLTPEEDPVVAIAGLFDGRVKD
jgi:tRNA dimethylallyltransferase